MMRKNISLLVICVLLALSLTALAEEAIPRFITEQQPIEAGSVLDAAASYTLIGYTSPGLPAKAIWTRIRTRNLALIPTSNPSR